MIRYRRRSALTVLFGKWGIIVGIALLVCLASFTARRQLTDGTDFLGGREEIRYFLKVNASCLAATALAVLADIAVFFIACVGKDNHDFRKPAACVTGLVISVFSCAAFIFSTVNIASDLKSTTVARPSTYVLCTDTKSAHFVGFTDKGEMTLIPIPEETYDKLKKGTVLDENKPHSDVYDAIESHGYVGTTEYSSAARIEYYFHSAMIEKAELLFE